MEGVVHKVISSLACHTIDEKIITQPPLQYCFPICPVFGAATKVEWSKFVSKTVTTNKECRQVQLGLRKQSNICHTNMSTPYASCKLYSQHTAGELGSTAVTLPWYHGQEQGDDLDLACFWMYPLMNMKQGFPLILYANIGFWQISILKKSFSDEFQYTLK